MRKLKKQLLKRTGNYFLWMALLLVMEISCQQDEAFYDPIPESSSEVTLKSNGLGNTIIDGTYQGSIWRIALPPNWFIPDYPYPRVLVFYAHGMADPTPYEPIQLPVETVEGEPIEKVITDFGVGYATTSFRDNGLIVLEAIKDIRFLTDVVKKFFEEHPDIPAPDIRILGGPSEGGLITIKTIEKYPKLFDGAMALCAPSGSFYDQLQYNGNFHVLFNYFFGDQLATMGIDLGNPLDGVHPDVMAAWSDGTLQPTILSVLDPVRLVQLMKCANVPVDLTDPVAMGQATFELLRFNIMLTNDVKERMMGVPFFNAETVYTGSNDDEMLNANVQRIDDQSFKRASNFIKKYETNGKIAVPLVTLHTSGDYVTPIWHQVKYDSKIFWKSEALLTSFPINRSGHCTFEKQEVKDALMHLLNVIGTPELTASISGKSNE